MDTPQLPAGPLRKALERFDAAFRDLGDDAALAGEMAEHERYLATVAAFDLDWESAPLRFAVHRADARR